MIVTIASGTGKRVEKGKSGRGRELCECLEERSLSRFHAAMTVTN